MYHTYAVAIAMNHNYAVTIAMTGCGTIFLRDQDKNGGIVASDHCEIGCLDATDLIVTGSVRKSTFGDYAVVDYVRRDAA